MVIGRDNVNCKPEHLRGRPEEGFPLEALGVLHQEGPGGAQQEELGEELLHAERRSIRGVFCTDSVISRRAFNLEVVSMMADIGQQQ